MKWCYYFVYIYIIDCLSLVFNFSIFQNFISGFYNTFVMISVRHKVHFTHTRDFHSTPEVKIKL